MYQLKKKKFNEMSLKFNILTYSWDQAPSVILYTWTSSTLIPDHIKIKYSNHVYTKSNNSQQYFNSVQHVHHLLWSILDEISQKFVLTCTKHRFILYQICNLQLFYGDSCVILGIIIQ